jgi:glycosyltransferase involved in cell wall biosynthesis
MHICMVGVKGIPIPAGIDNVVEQVGTRLVQRGHQVTAYVRPHYTPRDQNEYHGIRLVHVPSIRTRSLDAITSSFFAILLAIREKPDIIHIHSQGLSIFALLPRLFGIKTIVQSHGLDWQRAKWKGFARKFLKMTDYTTVAWPDATIVVSKKLQQYYQSHSKKEIIYIPNGAPEPVFYPPDEIKAFGLQENNYILFAARLVQEKWCHGLIEAYQKIENPSKILVIAGDSNYGDPYAEQLKKNASNKIRFLGFIQGKVMQELLSNAYFYVLPSEIEGLSTGLLEAMSYGRCVLVSDIEENLEAIGETGMQFQNNNVDSLSECLKYLIAHPGDVEEFGKLARRRVEQEYNWEIITDRYEECYSQLQSENL